MNNAGAARASRLDIYGRLDDSPLVLDLGGRTASFSRPEKAHGTLEKSHGPILWEPAIFFHGGATQVVPFLQLTWHLWGGAWKIHFLLKGPPVSCHVSGREGN